MIELIQKEKELRTSRVHSEKDTDLIGTGGYVLMNDSLGSSHIDLLNRSLISADSGFLKKTCFIKGANGSRED